MEALVAFSNPHNRSQLHRGKESHRVAILWKPMAEKKKNMGGMETCYVFLFFLMFKYMVIMGIHEQVEIPPSIGASINIGFSR